MDSDDSDFDCKLQALKAKRAEMKELPGFKPGFLSWFVQNKAQVVKTTMLKSVRIEASLGSPPRSFTTNDSETTNSISELLNTYRTEVINRTIQLDGSARPKRSPETAILTSGKSSKCNGRHHAFGSVSSSETRSTTSEVEF